MDSNVSKNTNSHNFFKLRVNRQKLAISVVDLLAKELLLALTLYQQKFNVKIEQNLLAAIITQKITILEPKNDLQSSDLIGYRCPLGMCLSKIWQESPAAITQGLGRILATNQKNDQKYFPFDLSIEIFASGWIHCYLQPKFIADWLNNSFYLYQTQVINDRPLSLEEVTSSNSDKPALFPAQYIHTRCCSLLSLATREKLIIEAPNHQKISPQIQDFTSIAWLDKKQDLWFTESTEYALLRQLLRITDAWSKELDSHQWAKVALNLSQVTANFLADCRFLGEIKAKYPQKAIARVGLIALVQFWLQRILREKLALPAPNVL